MPKKDNLWDEMPSNANPRIGAKQKSNFKFDKKWLIVILLIIGVLISAIVINTKYNNNTAVDTQTLDIDNGDLKINWEKYPTFDIELSENLIITTSGTYHLTGSLDNAYVLINVGVEGETRLILDNASINNSNGPAISCISADDLVIELIGENYLSDGTKYAEDIDEDVKGAIYSKSDLTLQGNGELWITANYQDGIVSKDDLKFNGGTYHVSASDDGIRGKDSVYIVDGDFDISAKGDAIKSTNETDTGKGFILIEDGNIRIASGDDGMHAIKTLIIQNGVIDITKSYEGLEAQKITIENGEISVIASDDGINAGGGSSNTSTTNKPGALDYDENCEISINGGNIYINASGDGVDSNGYIYFNGGKTIVDGPTNNGNGALDSGLGIFANDGEILAVGSSGMVDTFNKSSKIYSASIYLSNTQSANTKIEIKNSENEIILEHTSSKTFSHISVSSAYFEFGETYTIYLNNTEYQSFTVNDIVTTIGESNFNNMRPPEPQKR